MDQKQITEKIAALLTGPAGTSWVDSAQVLEPDGRGYSIGLALDTGEYWFITVEP